MAHFLCVHMDGRTGTGDDGPPAEIAHLPPNAKGCWCVRQVLATSGEHVVIARLGKGPQAGVADFEFQACTNVIAELIRAEAGDHLISGHCHWIAVSKERITRKSRECCRLGKVQASMVEPGAANQVNIDGAFWRKAHHWREGK